MILDLFTKNAGWKLLSVAAAFLIWMNIASEPDLATVISAPVEFRNFPRDLEISSSIVDSVDIDARGPAGKVRDFAGSRPSAVIDLASVTAPGERTFTLGPNEVKIPSGVQLVRTIPAQLRLKFEHRAQRDLKIDVPFSGKLPAGMEVVRMEVIPSTLTIIGPESHVMAAKDAVADPFDLSQVPRGTAVSEQHLNVFEAESEVRFTKYPQVTVKVHTARGH
jgi:hypothetical protein